jgi:hypothetical protein
MKGAQFGFQNSLLLIAAFSLTTLYFPVLSLAPNVLLSSKARGYSLTMLRPSKGAVDETETEPVLDQTSTSKNPKNVYISRRSSLRFGLSALAVATARVVSPASASASSPSSFEGFRRIQTQFIAALGDPQSSQGTNAFQDWGVWTVDPGPRGVSLQDAKTLERTRKGPYGWTFDPQNWWLEEHGLIMETPDFSLPNPGRYVVTGGRETTAILIINKDGSWVLDRGAKLADVTHLPCRAARYTSSSSPNAAAVCTPSKANPRNFPVRPGAAMPAVTGCDKQDYAVIFVIGVAEDNEKLLSEL